MTSSYHHLRQDLRTRREQLSPARQQTAAQSICQQVIKQTWMTESTSLAFYWSTGGEIDCSLLMLEGSGQGKDCYLPVIDNPPSPAMCFRRFDPMRTEILTPNRFGIPEPLTGTEIRISHLDLVFMPLVAFDRSGNRLGMGKGYYDRALAGSPDSPLRVGLGYTFQEAPSLEPSEWDIPLHIVITPDEVIHTPQYLSEHTPR